MTSLAYNHPTIRFLCADPFHTGGTPSLLDEFQLPMDQVRCLGFIGTSTDVIAVLHGRNQVSVVDLPTREIRYTLPTSGMDATQATGMYVMPFAVMLSGISPEHKDFEALEAHCRLLKKLNRALGASHAYKYRWGSGTGERWLVRLPDVELPQREVARFLFGRPIADYTPSPGALPPRLSREVELALRKHVEVVEGYYPAALVLTGSCIRAEDLELEFYPDMLTQASCVLEDGRRGRTTRRGVDGHYAFFDFDPGPSDDDCVVIKSNITQRHSVVPTGAAEPTLACFSNDDRVLMMVTVNGRCRLFGAQSPNPQAWATFAQEEDLRIRQDQRRKEEEAARARRRGQFWSAHRAGNEAAKRRQGRCPLCAGNQITAESRAATDLWAEMTENGVFDQSRVRFVFTCESCGNAWDWRPAQNDSPPRPSESVLVAALQRELIERQMEVLKAIALAREKSATQQAEELRGLAQNIASNLQALQSDVSGIRSAQAWQLFFEAWGD